MRVIIETDDGARSVHEISSGAQDSSPASSPGSFNREGAIDAGAAPAGQEGAAAASESYAPVSSSMAAQSAGSAAGAPAV